PRVLHLPRRPPPPSLFPYTTLFRSGPRLRPSRGPVAPRPAWKQNGHRRPHHPRNVQRFEDKNPANPDIQARKPVRENGTEKDGRDRKSTRLNSSHVAISYAVFCLKK